jgi:hypothetical protein
MVLYSGRTGWWKLTDFGITTPGTTTTLQPTEGSRGTTCYAAPELLLEGKFNKKTDIWAMGCLLYELYNGVKVFGTDWAVIAWAQSPQPGTLLPLGLSRFISEQANDPSANDPSADGVLSLYHSMLKLVAEERYNSRQLCFQIERLLKIRFPPPNPTSTVFRDPSQLIGTEVPIPTYFNPATYDQLLPPTARFVDLELLAERRMAVAKFRESIYGAQHRLTIWAHLYAAFTQYYLRQHDAALQTLSYALVCTGSVIDNISKSDLHAAITLAFCLITKSSDANVVMKIRAQLYGSFNERDMKLLRLDLSLLEMLVRLPDHYDGAYNFPDLLWIANMGLVNRLVMEENIGTHHVLTAWARCYVGLLYHRAGGWERGEEMILTAISTARKVLPPDSRDLLAIESILVNIMLEYRNTDLNKVFEGWRQVVSLLPRLIDRFGKDHHNTRRTIHAGRQFLKVVDTEDWTEFADAQEFVTAFGL